MTEPLCSDSDLLRALDSRDNLYAFLQSKLHWKVDPEDSFAYEDREAVGRARAHARLSQIIPFGAGDPFVIFLVEFKEKFRRGDLRDILRGVRKRIKDEAAYNTADLDEMVFVCTVPDTKDGPAELRFVQFEERTGRQPKLRVFGFDRASVGETHTLRTVNLPLLRLTTNLLGEVDWSACRKNWMEAWSVEKVTRQFFKDYKRVFETVRDKHIHGVSGEKQLFTQRLFNRLMFIHFLSKKGWLEFDERKDYLFALHEAAKAKREDLFHDRLYWAFFSGLGAQAGAGASAATHSIDDLVKVRGKVPYLNGGLFEMADADDVQGAVKVDNAAFDIIFDQLFSCYNFTVAESTPDDQDVAVDPEMLGKVFEELVTGRHESGSYYTPRPVVQFMCREALKGYLHHAVSPSPGPSLIGMREGSTAADATFTAPTSTLAPLSHSDEGGAGGGRNNGIDRFVDFHNADEITNHEAVLSALRTVRVVDPACGSGAYLLGMLQELMALRLALFNAKRLDDESTYNRKLEIIQNNLYGVDLDLFAVNTARLRLWLSLVVEDGRDPLTPSADGKLPAVALPNLDFKIEQGDSVSCPDPSGGLQRDMFRESNLQKLASKQVQYGDVRYLGNKAPLKKEIESLSHTIKAEANLLPTAFDWRVDFGTVFQAKETASPSPSPSLIGMREGSKSRGRGGEGNTSGTAPLSHSDEGGAGGGRSNEAGGGGFDIVLANPPYVRGELIKDLKPTLKRVYAERFGGTMDLYCFFYFRAIELLKDGGQLVFITPNKWFRAGYGEKLRATIAQTCRVRSITDFGDLPVFESATAYPMIFIAQKGQSASVVTRLAEPKTLDAPYPDVRAVVEKVGFSLPADAIAGASWNLSRSSDRMAKMRASGVPLGEYVKGQIFYGGDKRISLSAFILKGAQRDALIAADPKSEEIIKPFAGGRDIKRWHLKGGEKWIILSKIGTPMDRYPAIFAHLENWKTELQARQDKGDHYWELRACAYYPSFNQQKIVFPDIAAEARFAFDETGTFFGNTAYVMPVSDKYLLGVLNSKAVEEFYLQLSAQVRGGYLRFIRQYVEQIPVPAAPAAERAAIAALVQKCLDKKGVDVAEEEAEINARVAALYGL